MQNFTLQPTLLSSTDLNVKKNKGYLPQLDGLRALAVLMVVISHYWYWEEPINLYFFSGRTGVLIFFMISGYLITGILLDCREAAASNRSLLLHIWKRFCQRRVLRIFPLYYGALLLMFLLGFEDVRQHIWWHLAYLTNFLIVLEDDWFSNISHFWSLAIEEQFYIFWPMVVLFLPDRFLRKLLLSFMVIAPLFRLLMVLVWDIKTGFDILPFSVVDSLGLGALFAYLQTMQASGVISPRKLSLYLTYAGILMAFLFCGLIIPVKNYFYLNMAGTVLYDTIIIFTFSWLFIYALQNRNGWGISILTFRPLVYVGKISYGIYVFHLPVTNMMEMLFSFFNGTALYNSLSNLKLVFLWFLLTFTLSSLSWFLLESKLNRLKRHFPYLPKAKLSTVTH